MAKKDYYALKQSKNDWIRTESSNLILKTSKLQNTSDFSHQK